MDASRTEQSSSPDFELVRRSARRLTEYYFEVRKVVHLRRTLEECLADETQKISDLYGAYLPTISVHERREVPARGVFSENSSFIRF